MTVANGAVMPSTLRHFAVFAFLFVVPITVSVARADGAHGDFERSVVIGDTSGVVALGETWFVPVTDSLVGKPQCTDEGSCNGPSCHTPVERNPSSVENLTCDGIDCTAHVDSRIRAPGGSTGFTFSIGIDARTAGVAHVSFDLRDRANDVRHMEMQVRFADVAKIAVTRFFDAAPHGTVYAALSGADYDWCGVPQDAAGGALRFRPEGLELTARGPASQVSRAGVSERFRFVVSGTGEVTTSFRYGSFTRIDRIRVVSAEEILAVEVVDLDGISAMSKMTVEADPLRNARAARTVEIRGCEARTDEKRVLARGILRDGGTAILPGSALRVVPEELAALSVDGHPVRKLVARRRGSGTLEASVGDVTTSVDLVVRGTCLDQLDSETADAGADGDAGDDPDAGDASTTD